ncbi:EAL domain-containing protein [Methylophaga nitratireducenticrescens]|uniref:EAL domain-containing protein n=1 Tax=Methylophaga nitratireducenticrescens TaxID=754476 RepID=UPI00146B6667|nr:EAL domain-containing protein [Methylophaga nitratireducenticrescens]
MTNNNNNARKIIDLAVFPIRKLLDRLNYTRKFTILWLLSAVAIAVVVYSLAASLDRVIEPSERELQGLALIEPITQTIQFLQLHRGLSTTAWDNNTTMTEWQVAERKKMISSFMSMVDKLPAHLTSEKAFNNIQTNWRRLREEMAYLTMEERFIAHTRLIEQLQTFKLTVADVYTLTLDPQIETFYLMNTAIQRLPRVIEPLGQIRAHGSSILASRKMSDQQRIQLHILIARLETALKDFNTNLEKTVRHNTLLQASLDEVSEKIMNSARQVIELTQSDILSGHFTTPPDKFLRIATMEVDNNYTQLYHSLLTTARDLIQQRIKQAKKNLFTSVGGALLLLLLVVYFSVSIYYTIIGNIQSLVRTARAFANGDLDARIQLTTHDELRWVGDSFNEMADGFNAMLEARIKAETEQEEAKRAVMEGRERLHTVIDSALDAVVQMDAREVIIGWNHQAEVIFGWPREEVLGKTVSETIIPPQYREAHRQGLKHFLNTGDAPILNTRVEITGLHRNGNEFPVELAITPILISGKYEFSAFLRDITRKKESDALIWKQANFDSLTGLPNRQMFYDRMEQEIKKTHRFGSKIALLFIDLDDFKEINDTLGHSLGDILLQEAARRISFCVRESDTVARLGGDEFTVILAEIEEIGSAERVAGDILQKLAAPFRLGEEVVHVSASIGITLYPDDSTEIEALFRNADQAMYIAKNNGRNRFEFFTPAMQQMAQNRMRMIKELRVALSANQFRVFYQPIIDLNTGDIIKAEALIRWQHPERGLVTPAEFIPLAEETGLIVDIGNWVFRESARQLKHWGSLCDREFQISVNMSPIQFHSSDFVCKAWHTYLQELELPPHSFTIEITEGLLLDIDAAVTDKLVEFHDIGIQVAIDDFGTGYSSLSYLKRFDIDYLKIDQSFVRDLATDPDDMALSEAIIVMAHKLGLKVIAEGVETEAQQKLLFAAGCDYAQGYLYSRPIPAEALEQLLTAAAK